MYQEELKIPKSRIPILIGKQGCIKRSLQRELKVKIEIDSDEGSIKISGENGVDIYNTKMIIKAISRGFNPKIAIQLKDEDKSLEILDISNYCKDNKNKQKVIKSRLIGTNGKAKKNIERLTHTDIEIYGKTVSIIGDSSNVNIARQALERLMYGAKHSSVYSFIEKYK